MKKKRIVILVDNPLRDLPACCLTAAFLSEKHDVFLASSSQATSEIFHLQPDLVLLNYLRETNKHIAQVLINAGIDFSILDTEGGFFMDLGSKENSFTFSLVREDKIREAVAHYFCWGETLAKTLSSRKSYREESIQCLGTPRLDFYHPSYRQFFGNVSDLKTELIGRSDLKVVLINTSFSIVNSKFSTREKEFEMMIEKFRYEREFMTEFFKKMDEIVAGYIEATAYLADQFPEVFFVLRPHPFESLDPYIAKLGHYKNIKVDCTKTVTPWLLISDALLHYECSTAAEGAFLDVPSFSLLKFKEVRPVPQIRTITDYASSLKDLKTKIADVLNKKYVSDPSFKPALQKIESEIYFKVDGLAAKRISDRITEFCEKQNPSKKNKLVALKYRLFFSARSLAKLLVKGNLIPESKKFTVKEAQEISKRLEPIIGIKPKVSSVCLSGSAKFST